MKWLIPAAGLLAALLLVGCVVFFGYWSPRMGAVNSMKNGVLELDVQQDGSVLLTWPEGQNADGYLVRLLETGTAVEEEIFRAETPVNEMILRDLPSDREIEIRIDSFHNYKVIFSDELRRMEGTESLSVTGIFQPPAVSGLQWVVDEETDVLTVSFRLPENGVCRVYHGTGEGLEQIDSLDTGEMVIQFGPDSQFSMPERNQKHIFAFDVVCTCDAYVFTGIKTGEIVINREGLLGTDLNARWADEGDNVHSVTWDETKGAYYVVERYDKSADEWIVVHTVQPDEERAYTTGHLSRYSSYTYRVAAVGGETLPDSEYAAISEEYTFTTASSVIYSTVWPMKDLKVYADSTGSTALGTAPEGQAYCVLGVEGNFFRIRFGDGEGYIDNRYCMINLPEMIGSLCGYDIKNSYSSIYKIHDYNIPKITGTVITGYENVKQSGGGYLVPLLYPTALKLEKAAFAARDAGYRLKIYDSYRPKKATLLLYDLTSKIINDPVPGQKESPVKTTPEGETVPAQKPVTYRSVMTDNDRYALNYFLAKGGSRHNQGIALDLTLEKLSGGKELQMQTAMHDLSWYSENKLNNSNANKLRNIMVGAGFTGLVSEWWHFQDNDAKDQLNPPYLYGGLSAECWMADDTGWRYRTATGKYLTDTTRSIDGVEYAFDADGYVIQPQEETEPASNDAG